MLNKLFNLGKAIGNTPLVKIEEGNINLFAKLEMLNLSGSIKARPAYFILSEAIKKGQISKDTTIVESTSGNFGIALATLCKNLGIKFIPVIDSNINPIYESQLNLLSFRVEKVTERDHTGGFLLTRLDRVKQLLLEIEDNYWVNQYSNENNYLSYYKGLGQEIINSFDTVDYAFIGVSSCGTISGISRRLKEHFKNIKIIGVDSEGSVIFGDQPKKRHIPGIGSSIVPPIIKNALIDEVILVPEFNSVEGCNQLLNNHGIFAGGSSGSVYFAIKQYFKDKEFATPPNVISFYVDSGGGYIDTIYNPSWVEETYPKEVIVRN